MVRVLINPEIMEYTEKELQQLNEQLRNLHPGDIITWSMGLGKRTVLTTNFRPYEAAILHAVTEIEPEIPVIWCDTGYNTEYTYRHADELIQRFGLNVFLYSPLQSTALREARMGIPDIDDPRHREFTDQVKLEPFRRAFSEHLPEMWFTNLRQGQTQHRDTLDILSISADGIMKISPFYFWSDREMDTYLQSHGLPNEFRYYDPTKVYEDRECGLHS